MKEEMEVVHKNLKQLTAEYKQLLK